MTVTAGYLAGLSCCATTDGAYKAIGQCTAISGFPHEKAKIDTTAFGGAGAETCAGGIQKAVTFTLTCLADAADAGQALLITAYGNSSAIWFQGKWDGTYGDNVECKCLKKTQKPALTGGWVVDYELTISGLIDQSMHALG
jgi:hypothetical protein